MSTDSGEDTFNETTNPDMPTKNIQETISINSGDTLKESIIPQTTTKYVQADLSDSESIVSDNIRKEHSILKNLSKMVELKIKELNQSKSILEFKYNLDFDEEFRNRINQLNLRFSKNSKYVNSIIEYPDLVSN